MIDFLLEKYQRRVHNSLRMYNKFEEGSWGYEYWGDVLSYNVEQLNEYINQGEEYEKVYNLH